MYFILIAEAIAAAVIILVIYLSFAYDHEGEWLDTSTGERFNITRVGGLLSGVSVAASGIRSIILTRDGFDFMANSSRGKYDRWRGRIDWPTAVWRRISSGKLNFINWISMVNLIKNHSLDGTWFGTSSRGLLLLDLEWRVDKFIANLHINNVSEDLAATVTKTGLHMTNHLGEDCIMSWDGESRSVLDINNEQVILERLDS